ncbi:MAG: hypothetical protein Q8P41_26410 [Pseudomonadota bacterium]|nr:hypothetical protein [Pseudomonadota bacterium]
MLILLSLLLGASDAEAARLERLTLGVAGSLRAGDPSYLSHPIELSVTSFVLPWLAFEGRIGVAPTWDTGYFFFPDGEPRGLLSTGVRFGKEQGIYGAVNVIAWMYEPSDKWDRHYGLFGVFDWYSLAARGGWRFPLGKASYVAPEVYIGTFFAGAGVHFEWVLVKK